MRAAIAFKIVVEYIAHERTALSVDSDKVSQWINSLLADHCSYIAKTKTPNRFKPYLTLQTTGSRVIFDPTPTPPLTTGSQQVRKQVHLT